MKGGIHGRHVKVDRGFGIFIEIRRLAFPRDPLGYYGLQMFVSHLNISRVIVNIKLSETRCYDRISFTGTKPS